MSIENIMVDIKDLERGMEMTKKECSHRKDVPTIVKDFVSNSEDKIKKLKTESRHAQVGCCEKGETDCLPISHFPHKLRHTHTHTGRVQQSDRVLWRELQNNISQRLLLHILALHQGLQGFVIIHY